MKIISLSLIAMLLMTFGVLYNEADISPQNITESIAHVQNSTFNLTTNSFPYTDLYRESPSVDNVVNNFLHGMIYVALVDIHTLVPVVAYAVKDMPWLFKLSFLVLSIMFIGTFFKILYGFIALIFFFKEKKRMDEKVYE